MNDRLHALLGEVLRELGHTPGADPELERTPERLAALLRERFAPLDTLPTVRPLPTSAHDQLIVLRDLPFHSFCVHHVVPFFGHVHIAYRPGDHILGFGAFGHVVEAFSRKPQLQERMTEEIANFLFDALQPRTLLVASRARQMCMDLCGAGVGATTDCLALRGDTSEGASLAPWLLPAERP